MVYKIRPRYGNRLIYGNRPIWGNWPSCESYICVTSDFEYQILLTYTPRFSDLKYQILHTNTLGKSSILSLRKLKNWTKLAVFKQIGQCIHMEKKCSIRYVFRRVYFKLQFVYCLFPFDQNYFGNMIRSIQRCFYAKTTERHQSIWQMTAILESENLFLLLWRHWYFLQ